MKPESTALLNIAFLFDPENDWIRPLVEESNRFVSENDRTFIFAHDPDDLSGFDLVFVLGFTKILDQGFLEQNGLTMVVHESDLPKGKGFAPVQWQILEGANRIPICLLEAASEVDGGDILMRGEIVLDGTELYPEIRQKQASATMDLIEDFLNTYPDIKRQKQSGEESRYRRRTLQDGELDPDKSLAEQFDLLRIGNNEEWPSFFRHKGHKYVLKIYKETDSSEG